MSYRVFPTSEPVVPSVGDFIACPGLVAQLQDNLASLAGWCSKLGATVIELNLDIAGGVGMNCLLDTEDMGGEIEESIGDSGSTPDPIGSFQPPIRAIGHEPQAISRTDVNKGLGLGYGSTRPICVLYQMREERAVVGGNARIAFNGGKEERLIVVRGAG